MDRAEQFGRHYARLSREYRQYMEQQLAPHLTVGQLTVLELINGKEKVKPSDLIPALETSAAAVTTLLDRMEKNGLIERVRDTQDRRIVWTYMSMKGKRELMRGMSIRKRFFEETLSGLSQHNQQVLLYLLGKLASADPDKESSR